MSISSSIPKIININIIHINIIIITTIVLELGVIPGECTTRPQGVNHLTNH